MMGARGIKHLRSVVDPAAFRVRSAEMKGVAPRETDGGGAHWARLQRHPNRAPDQAFRPDPRARPPDGQHFGMGGRITQRACLVTATADNPARRIHNNRADRHFAP